MSDRLPDKAVAYWTGRKMTDDLADLLRVEHGRKCVPLPGKTMAQWCTVCDILAKHEKARS